MLILIGLGLWDAKDITLRGLEEAKSADFAYLEGYTARLFGTTRAEIESLLGKKIPELKRVDIEINTKKILEQARKEKVAILVPGDPMVATTHSDLVLRARKMGIETKIIHNASIYSAIGECGLEIYKFGKTTTLPFFEKNFRPTSFYDAIRENLERGLHTLVLMDIRAEENRFLPANEGLKTLLELDKEGIVKNAVVLGRIGSDKPLIRYGPASQLVGVDFGPPLHALVIPGKLHPMEKEFLESL